MLVLDLAVFHRESRESTIREAAIWTCIWCALALAFDGLLWWKYGPDPALLFLTGYLVEWSLSMDNVFVFAVIFNWFVVPKKYQYRVLFWGILGAIVMRLAFIVAGDQLLKKFEWIMLLFGGFLIFTGIKLSLHDDGNVHPDQNIVLRLARRIFPVAHGDHGDRFFVRDNGKLAITPLFLVLLVVESTDVLFAVDSVPAIFAITREPFLIYTSNIFAIMGLRALYFLLAGVMDMFRYLNYGLSAILAFVGLKMMTEYAVHHWEWAEENFRRYLWEYEEKPISPVASLLVIVGLLATSIIASLIANRRDAQRAAAGHIDVSPPAEEVPAQDVPGSEH